MSGEGILYKKTSKEAITGKLFYKRSELIQTEFLSELTPTPIFSTILKYTFILLFSSFFEWTRKISTVIVVTG